MLKEVEAAKQEPGEDFRRWFRDEYFDLYVWTNQAGTVTGFQLCYDKPGDEHALTWFHGKGFFHHRIDPGDQAPNKNLTPTLVQDGLFQGDEVERRFAESSKSLDAGLAAFVSQKLREYRSPPTGALPPAAPKSGASNALGVEARLRSLPEQRIGAVQQSKKASYRLGFLLILLGFFLPFFGTYLYRWGIGWSYLSIGAGPILGAIGLVLRARASMEPQTRSGRLLDNFARLVVFILLIGVAVIFGIALSNFQVMEKKALMSEAKFGLSNSIYTAAIEVKIKHNTYETTDRSDLRVIGPDGNPFRPGRYSFWYSINGVPTAVPGSAQTSAPCDLTNPPTSVKVTVSAAGFVAAAKGNIDGDATCDEWSMNEKRELTHTLDDLEK